MRDHHLLLRSTNLEVVRRAREVRGVQQHYDVVLRPRIVIAVLRHVESKSLVFVKQHREAVREVTLELPAGKVERDEDPFTAVRRETAEETGLMISDVSLLGTIYTAPHFSNELAHVFAASASGHGKSTPTSTEDLRGVALVAPALLNVRIADGSLRDGKSLASLALWRAVLAIEGEA